MHCKMGLFCLLAVFVFNLCSQQCFAQEEPAFPSYSGDIIVTGFVVLGDLPEVPITYWWSESNKAIRQDYKGFLGLRSRMELENQGQYGSIVSISKKIKDDHTECTIKKGTEEIPITYRPLLGASGNRTYLGVTNVEGLKIHQWELDIHGQKQKIYMREDENGLVPYRVVFTELSLFIQNISKSNIPPDTFSYDADTCKVEDFAKYQSIKDLVEM